MNIDYRNELKRIGIGLAITMPLIAAYFLLDFLIDQQILNKEIVGNILLLTGIMLMCWTVGGAYESYREMKRLQTDNAFRKLGLKD
jgi:hypothetical protein